MQRLGAFLRELRQLAPLGRWHARAAPLVLLLGLAAAILESLGVSLVVLFLYVLLGRGEDAVAAGGALGRIFTAANGWFGGSSVALGLLIFGLILGKALVNLAYGTVIATARNRISEEARNRVQARYLDMAYAEFRARDAGALMNILGAETWSLAESWHAAARISINLCAIAVFGALLLAVSWQITLLAVTGSALVSLGIRLLHRRVKPLGEAAMAANRRLAARMLDTMQGMRTIRAFGEEVQDKRRFTAASAEVRRRFDRLERLYTLVGPLGEIGSLALLGVLVVVALWMQVPAATTLAAVALLHRLNPHIRELEGHAMKLAGSLASLTAVRDILEAKAEPPPDGEAGFTGLRREIRFQAVTLTHRGAAVASLHQVGFAIPRGTLTALVGPSGAGKTSVVNLLLRLYEPDAGRILVDGVPLAALRRRAWLSRLALAGQDTDLFEGSIAENLRFGCPDASQEALRHAAATAGILDFIERLPLGFDSPLSNQGLNLSGGQRQRITLARALVRRPAVLILDEATNALDGALDDDIRQRLRAHDPEMTILVITHRLAGAATADHVVCLTEGRAVEEGPPAQLLHQPGGAFRAMLERSAA